MPASRLRRSRCRAPRSKVLSGILIVDIYIKGLNPAKQQRVEDALAPNLTGTLCLMGSCIVASRPSRFALRVFLDDLSSVLDHHRCPSNALLKTHLAITHAETRNHLWYPIQGSLAICGFDADVTSSGKGWKVWGSSGHSAPSVIPAVPSDTANAVDRHRRPHRSIWYSCPAAPSPHPRPR